MKCLPVKHTFEQHQYICLLNIDIVTKNNQKIMYVLLELY